MSKEYISPERKKLEQLLEEIERNEPVEPMDEARATGPLTVGEMRKVLKRMFIDRQSPKAEKVLFKKLEKQFKEWGLDTSGSGKEKTPKLPSEPPKDFDNDLEDFAPALHEFPEEAQKLIRYLGLYTWGDERELTSNINSEASGKSTFTILDASDDDTVTFAMSYQDEPNWSTRGEGQSDWVLKVKRNGVAELYDWVREHDRTPPTKKIKIKSNNLKQIVDQLGKIVGKAFKPSIK